LEDNGQSAALRASSSLSGKNLLNEGFRIGFNDPGIVGRVLRRAKSIVFSGQPGRQVTLPLTVRGQVIGALDVRSDQPESAGHSEVETFQLIADQLAASIENARLVAQSRSTVSQLEALSARGTRNAWQEYLKNRDWAFRFTPSGMSSVSPAQEAATPEGLRVPVLLRGQKIGSIALSRRTAGAWEPADRELAERVAAQLALALENARLLEQTRERAAQEQIISEISARLNRSLDVDAVLQAAVREFAGLPDVAEAEITLTPSGAGNHHAGS
jgi:K+-sensing histidine kinase KdpD